MEMTDDERKLRLEFYKLEKYYRPLFDLYTENQSEYPEYHGSTTLDSYLVYQPDVLILGYNPAHGKYQDYKKEGAHLVYTGERPFGLFEWGNANKKAAWYAMNEKTENSYPKNILHFLFKLAELRKWGTQAPNDKPTWGKKAEEKIMLMNLYPIGTKDGKTLRNLFAETLKEISTLYGQHFEDDWAFRAHLVRKLHIFIENFVKPKAILCLGKSTISDYSWNAYKKSEYEGVFVAKNYKNVVGVSRTGTWTNRAKNAAYLINEILG